MFDYINRLTSKIGKPPGTPEHTGERLIDDTSVTIFRYNYDTVEEEYHVINITDEKDKKNDAVLKSTLLESVDDSGYNHWLNFKGIHDLDLISVVAEKLGLHSLTLEDILNTGIRPKLELFDDYLFIVLKSFRIDDDFNLESEQVSIVIRKNTIISFQEGGERIFTKVKERVRNRQSRLRENKYDYLAYAMIDVIVDNYFLVLEEIAEQVELLEEDLLEQVDRSMLRKIHHFKRNVISLRKSLWPTREVIHKLSNDDNPFIHDKTVPYLRDLNDHIIQVLDIAEYIDEMLTNLHDMYMTTVSNRMNEIMKVLTIIATIFIPLTFLAGIYGMNFNFMPELEIKGAYFVLLGFMLVLALLMIIYFKRKKWF